MLETFVSFQTIAPVTGVSQRQRQSCVIQSSSSPKTRGVSVSREQVDIVLVELDGKDTCKLSYSSLCELRENRKHLGGDQVVFVPDWGDECTALGPENAMH